MLTFTLTGDYDNDGDPSTGYLKFTSNEHLINTVDDSITTPFTVRADLDVDGHLEVVLRATTDPDVTPQGWAYVVDEVVDGHTRRYFIQLTEDSDITDLQPLTEPTPPERYVLKSELSESGGGGGDGITQDEADARYRQLSETVPDGDIASTIARDTEVATAKSQAISTAESYADSADTTVLASAETYADDAVTAHIGASDPHPQYETQTEADARYFRPASGTTLTDADIPAAIARDSEVTAAVSTAEAYADAVVTTHTGATDPHGDRASAASLYIPLTQKAAASGVASLDGSGRVPISQLPLDLSEYKGAWNANTNTPSISDAVGDLGDFYKVTVGGTRDLGSGSQTFRAGDTVIYGPSNTWEQVGSADAVTSVAGRTGVITLTATDVGLANVTNDAQLKAADKDTDGTLAANSDSKIASQKAVKTYVDALQAAFIFTLSTYVQATLSTDGTLAANSDSNVATQKATKTYADTKIPKTVGVGSTKGDLIGYSSSGTPVRIAWGSGRQRLIKDSSVSPGLKWSDEIDIQVFDTATAGSDWTPPAFIDADSIVDIYVQGPGAGGGAGRRSATSVIASGGGGGGAGGSSHETFHYSDLLAAMTADAVSTLKVVITAGGAGASAVADSTDGGSGTSPASNSRVGTTTSATKAIVSAAGGSGGGGGTATTAGAAGAGGAGMYSGGAGGAGGASGVLGNTSPGAPKATGGAGAGGITAANAASAGATANPPLTRVSSGSTAAGANGVNGLSVGGFPNGAGGGGGTAVVAGTTGNGGNGAFGAGGGGGAGGRNGQVGGAGGNGGVGRVVIITRL